jgi:hypothetical protein
MTREEFDALIARLETKAGKNPKSFKWRVGAWAAFGFSYLLLVRRAWKIRRVDLSPPSNVGTHFRSTRPAKAGLLCPGQVYPMVLAEVQRARLRPQPLAGIRG